MFKILYSLVDEATVLRLTSRALGIPDLAGEEIADDDRLIGAVAANRGKVEAVVLGERIPNICATATRLRLADHQLPVIVMTEPDRLEPVERMLTALPLLGKRIHCCSATDYSRQALILREAILGRRQWRKFRGTIETVKERVVTLARPRPKARQILDKLLDSVPIGVVVLDSENRIQDLNRKAETLLETKRSQAIGEKWADRFLSNASPQLHAFPDEIPDALRPGSRVVERLDGKSQKLVLELTAVPIADSAKAFTLVLLEDITERVAIEESRRHTTRLLDALNHAQSQFISDVDPRTLFDELLHCVLEVTASKFGFIGEVLFRENGDPYLKSQAITNISWDEESRALYEKYAPTGFEFFNLKTLFGAVLKTRRTVIANDAASDPRSGGVPPGHPPLKSFLGLPLMLGDHIVGMIGIANRPSGYDSRLIRFLEPLAKSTAFMIQAWRGERNRQEAQQLLSESERRFRLMIEHLHDLITIVDSEGIIQFQSPSCRAILGYGAEDLMQRNVFEFIHTEDARNVRAELAIAAGERNPRNPVVFRFRHADGSWRVLESIGTPLQHPPSRLVVANSRDITERCELENRLRQSQKLEAVGQLAGGIAHEFNNVLTVITCHADLLRRNGAGTELEGHAEDIASAARRAADLTRSLLAFSRRQMIRPVELDLNKAVNRMVQMLQPMLGEKIIQQTNLAPDLPLVKADHGMFDQLLLNLAINARDAMPEGGWLTFSTSAAFIRPEDVRKDSEVAEGRFVCLRVSDTGCGIADTVLPHIFEPFYTSKEVGQGSGLGLSTVYGIVKQHEGWIRVASKVGDGTAFQIFLPALAGRREALFDRPSPASDMPAGNETILVVEDETAVRSIIRTVLGKCGYRVTEAASAAEALRLWDALPAPIDLLLTDIVMPGTMNGPELAAELQSRQPGLKVLFSSGYSLNAIEKGRRFHEGLNFLQKPFHPRTLAQAVRNRLDSKI